MACTQSGIILLLIAASAVVQGQPEVTLTSDNTQVTPGGTISVTCAVRNLVGGASFVRIQKYFHTDPVPVQFSTNSILQPDFKDNSRFKITFTAEADQPIIFLLTITDVRPEDSGTYSCAIYNGEGIESEDKKDITVINVEAFTVKLRVTRISTNDVYEYVTGTEETHKIKLDNSEDFKVEIETSAASPKPDVEVKVGSRSITDQFTLETVPEEYEGTDSGLKGVKFLVRGSATIHIDHSFSSGLVLEASVGEYAEAEEKFTVEFSGFPPKFEDCPTVVKAGDHERNVNINCTFVSSDPPEVLISYNRELVSGKMEKVNLFPAEYNSQYVVEYNQVADEQRYVVSLGMEVVYPQMFRNYTVYVKNNRGNLTHTFLLEEDPDKAFNGNPSKSSHVIISIAMTFLLAMATAMFQRL